MIYSKVLLEKTGLLIILQLISMMYIPDCDAVGKYARPAALLKFTLSRNLLTSAVDTNGGQSSGGDHSEHKMY